jgi:hypothetical protein
MKKSLLVKLVFLWLVATNLSGCIILPLWDDGGGYHHGGYHGERWGHGYRH